MNLRALVLVSLLGCTGQATVTTTTPVPPPPPPSSGTVVVTQAPEKHPAYLHALTDLRAARSFLSRPAGINVKWDEKRAITEIDAAIREIKQASIDDGKNIDDHPPVDVPQWGDRLHRSLELVEKARADISKEEDNAFANGLRTRAVGHLDLAIRFVHDGIEDSRAHEPPIPPPPPAEHAHPAYLHALTDLRMARHLLEKPARPVVKWDENRAIREIDAAIREIKEASIDDGKNINEHPVADAGWDHHARLRKAMELLEAAVRDVEQKEDNGFARGLRNRAVGHMNAAAKAIRDANIDAHH
jgi:hypothetical protein